jgi:hypothetical protein
LFAADSANRSPCIVGDVRLQDTRFASAERVTCLEPAGPTTTKLAVPLIDTLSPVHWDG